MVPIAVAAVTSKLPTKLDYKRHNTLLERCFTHIEDILEVLSKFGHFKMSEDVLLRTWHKFAIDDLHKCGLSCPVRANQSNTCVEIQTKVHVRVECRLSWISKTKTIHGKTGGECGRIWKLELSIFLPRVSLLASASFLLRSFFTLALLHRSCPCPKRATYSFMAAISACSASTLHLLDIAS